jgi:hypothetical protein
MKEGDLVAQATCECGHQLADACGQSEASELDRAQHQHIGNGLGHRENAEHRIALQRLLSRRIRMADRGVNAQLAAAHQRNHRAVVASRGHILRDRMP